MSAGSRKVLRYACGVAPVRRATWYRTVAAVPNPARAAIASTVTSVPADGSLGRQHPPAQRPAVRRAASTRSSRAGRRRGRGGTRAGTEPGRDAGPGPDAAPGPRAAAGGDHGGGELLRRLVTLTADLPDTDPGRVAAAALRGRSAGAGPAELRELATEAAAGLISEDPAYSRLAARLLTRTIAEEAAGQGAVSFAASIAVGHREGLIADRTAEFVTRHADRLNALVARALVDGADQRLVRLGFAPVYGSQNPFSFMELQGVQELTNFFERRASAYQVAVEGSVALDEEF